LTTASLLLDLKQALRMLRRSPGLALMAIVTLALGVAAATAIFSVVNGVVLRPLPFSQPERLVQIFETNQRTDAFTTSEPTFLDMRAQTSAFAEVAAYRFDSRNLQSDGDPEQLSVVAVSANLFALLGVQPALGSGFVADDDRAAHPAPSLVLTDAYWRSRFGGRRDVIGHVVRLDEQSYTIVGVTPPRFDFPGGIVAYTPLGADPAAPRANHLLTPIARLKPGMTLAQARADLSSLAQRLGEQYPASNRNWGMRVVSLHEAVVGPAVARTVWILWAAVMLLLAMACANVANLLMARATTRQQEITVRAALGASRAMVARQLLVESLPLALSGGGLGVALAWLGVALVRRLAVNVPRVDEIAIDGRVLAFAAVVSIASALVFGAAPLVQLSTELRAGMGAGGRISGGRGRRRTIEALVALQIAVALVLLVGAGLMMRSFVALSHVDPGFRVENVLAVRVALSPTQYKPPEMVALYRRIDGELQTLPGVDAAGGISVAPELDGNTYTRFLVSDRPERDDEFLMASWRSPTPGYFRALGIALLRGRLETSADFDPDARVALVSRTAAERFWPDRDPIGQIVTPYARRELHYTVVGVVSDVRDVTLDAPPEPAIYLCGRSWPAMTFLLHTTVPPLSLAKAVRERMRAVSPNVPFTLTTLTEALAASIGQQRFAGAMLAIFSTVALTLALIGVFGVISFSVAQRTREIGIRQALGAQPADLLRLFLARGIALAGVGIVAGLLSAIACTRVLRSLLYAVGALDPIVFVSLTALLAVTALAASWLAARRVVRVDPMVALRYD
jgi:putative ABC transport system permease protein